MCSDQGGYRKKDKGLRRDRGKKAGKSSGGEGKKWKEGAESGRVGAGQGQEAKKYQKAGKNEGWN